MNKYLLDNWITLHYAATKEKLSLRGRLDEDSLQETYLVALREKEATDYDDIGRVFLKCYAVCLKRAQRGYFQYVTPDALFFDMLHEEDEQEETTEVRDTRPLAKTVMKYIRVRTKPMELTMFNMYMFEGMPYSTIAECMGVTPNSVKNTIEKIKTDTKHYFEKA